MDRNATPIPGSSTPRKSAARLATGIRSVPSDGHHPGSSSSKEASSSETDNPCPLDQFLLEDKHEVTCDNTSEEEGVVKSSSGQLSPKKKMVQSQRAFEKGQDHSTTSSSSESDEASHLLARRRRIRSTEESPEVVPMSIDTCEDLWTRLHDIRVNGCTLEYIGRGKSIYDNGLAQSNTPLTPLNHYFEITILNPGESCYIAIGLARKDYPVHKHPGWNRGSIAYHADDGKIFIGSGAGTPFGPRCNFNDILGCGIVFPNKIDPPNEWPWEMDGGAVARGQLRPPRSRPPRLAGNLGQMENLLEPSSESEDDIWWNNKNQVYEEKVKVFFMRNGKLLGIKEIRIPKGGFYPTVGMMSLNEKIMMDMSPLSG